MASILPSLPAAVAVSHRGQVPRPVAIVYRGDGGCEGCSESVGRLLANSSYKFDITYAGPDEEVDLSRELLSKADIYAYPGGPDVEASWEELEKYAKMIRDFVHGGGRYMGFCLGAYLAGETALDLMPEGIDIDSEIEQEDAQVDDDRDTTIQVDWKFNAGTDAQRLEEGRWVYFQEGAVMLGFDDSDPHVIARYTANNDVAASVTPYGKGFVGLVGPHPEADKEWYESEDITNPDGIRTDIGYDFVRATVLGINGTATKNKPSEKPGSSADASQLLHIVTPVLIGSCIIGPWLAL